jgi:hypothetical protein
MMNVAENAGSLYSSSMTLMHKTYNIRIVTSPICIGNCANVLKFRVFWDVAPCSEIDVDRRFRGAYCLHYQGDRPLKRRST